MTYANVLIVEDEGILAIELKDKLEKLGYNVPATASLVLIENMILL